MQPAPDLCKEVQARRPNNEVHCPSRSSKRGIHLANCSAFCPKDPGNRSGSWLQLPEAVKFEIAELSTASVSIKKALRMLNGLASDADFQAQEMSEYSN